MPDTSTEVALLKQALNSGVTSVTVDGQTTTFQSPADIRRRIRELEASDPNVGRRRPVVSSMDLTGT